MSAKADEDDDWIEASDESEELVAQVAWYYYNDGLRQGDIADRLGLSRIKVSRLLDRGRQSGLIEVQINSRYEGGLRLQDELIKRFGLNQARVIPALDEAPPDTRIGQAAAKFLARWLQPRDLLAIGWGRAVNAALRTLSPTLIKREISLVSLTGGVSSYVAGVGMNGAHSDVHLIPTPLRVSTPEFAEMLGREPYVRNVLSMALTARVAIVGIGATSRNATLVRDGYCTMAEIDLFVRQGAVGDILGYFYDRDGNILSLDLHDHVVAVKPDDLKRIPSIVGAAAGVEKVEPILGALRGKLINILVTDETTARNILGRTT
jgi:lsr operon transcriptional repressor